MVGKALLSQERREVTLVSVLYFTLSPVEFRVHQTPP